MNMKKILPLISAVVLVSIISSCNALSKGPKKENIFSPIQKQAKHLDKDASVDFPVEYEKQADQRLVDSIEEYLGNLNAETEIENENIHDDIFFDYVLDYIEENINNARSVEI